MTTPTDDELHDVYFAELLPMRRDLRESRAAGRRALYEAGYDAGARAMVPAWWEQHDIVARIDWLLTEDAAMWTADMFNVSVDTAHTALRLTHARITGGKP